MSKKPFISVIVPAYNQVEPLTNVLEAFNYQSIDFDKFEVILVDDGSEKDLSIVLDNFVNHHIHYTLNIIRQPHCGRATARNNGIFQARGDLLLFNDGDRIPDRELLTQHQKSHCQHQNCAVIGVPLECFCPPKIMQIIDLQTLMLLHKYSREPEYYRKIKLIYNEGNTNSHIAWASFLVGNSSVKKTTLEKTGYFDEDFKSWGFEHFELGLRLQKSNVKFINNTNAYNYHQPHLRERELTISNIVNSFFIIKNKHPDLSCDGFIKYFLGKISLQEFALMYNSEIKQTKESAEPIYYQGISKYQQV
jgi:glycosyltransferase involved in cell wall biosynthesis